MSPRSSPEAVAKRISSRDLHEGALQDMGAFVHRTVAEDEHTYAVRIDDGSMLDSAEQIEHSPPPRRRRATPARRDPGLRARAARR
jgi:hypothetical protein